jgi:hypothetical protein
MVIGSPSKLTVEYVCMKLRYPFSRELNEWMLPWVGLAM